MKTLKFIIDGREIKDSEEYLTYIQNIILRHIGNLNYVYFELNLSKENKHDI